MSSRFYQGKVKALEAFSYHESKSENFDSGLYSESYTTYKTLTHDNCEQSYIYQYDQETEKQQQRRLDRNAMFSKFTDLSQSFTSDVRLLKDITPAGSGVLVKSQLSVRKTPKFIDSSTDEYKKTENESDPLKQFVDLLNSCEGRNIFMKSHHYIKRDRELFRHLNLSVFTSCKVHIHSTQKGRIRINRNVEQLRQRMALHVSIYARTPNNLHRRPAILAQISDSNIHQIVYEFAKSFKQSEIFDTGKLNLMELPILVLFCSPNESDMQSKAQIEESLKKMIESSDAKIKFAAGSIIFNNVDSRINGLSQCSSDEIIISTVKNSTITGIRFLRFMAGRTRYMTKGFLKVLPKDTSADEHQSTTDYQLAISS